VSVVGGVKGSDRQLVEQIERIYRGRYERLCRMATAVTGGVDTAHDAVQEGFALALAHRHTFRGEGPLAAWIARIVLRAALDTRRVRTAETSLRDEFDFRAFLWVPSLPHAERDPVLASALRALSRRQRQVVFLRYFADLSHAEIAAVTGAAPGTVSATLAQARAALAQRLHEQPHSKEIQR
jgi:RNA polymerase sigma-70 factor, ECF subfamily